MKPVLAAVLYMTLPAAVCGGGNNHEFERGRLIDITTTANRYGYRFAVFVVQVGDLVYTGEGDRLGRVTESLITFAVTKSGYDGHDLIVGDPIDASIDVDHMVLRRPNGKELRTKIIKRERVADGGTPR
ncbi:MAG TPA: hypothetical protein VIY49_26980 [Bryobacteraceae bacterium]